LIQDDISRSRVNWFSTTLLLLAVILLVVVLVLRRSLSLPLNELLKAARAVGRGDLSYRVEFSKEKRDEISLLANEFNRMADNLAEQKRTAEREAENRLELERQLRHSERLAAVGRLAAGIAHEFGAPLNVIDARAEQLINKRELPPEKQTKNLRIIREQTNRISHIVHQLLNLARPYNFHLSTVNVTKSLRDTLEQIEQNAVDCSVEIDFLDADNEYKIAADEDFLRQVWLNIFQNALQAMLRGGKLIVNCVHEKIDQKHFVAVRICDSGTGIAPEHLDKIFDAFYTTKDIGKGTGLGLAVARRIIEEHGGNIEAANSEQGGAIFTVRLPLLTTENEWTKKF
jgi:signal transduction histidine kinase